MTVYQYMVIARFGDLEAKLNKWGRQGWRVIELSESTVIMEKRVESAPGVNPPSF